ncbi:MAG: Gfo/Idh/MocA family oxidoreductase [Planctomycetota bacterium]
MTGRRTRLALVGSGFIADVHLTVLRGLRDVEVVALVDPVVARAERLARKHGVRATHATVDALLAAGGVDAVHLLVPPALHAELAVRCLDAGLAVLVEKPMALREPELEALGAAAARSGAVLAVNHNQTFHPSLARLCNHLGAGRLGRLEHVALQHNVPLRQLATGDVGHFMFQTAANILWEQGVHLFSMVFALLGECRAVQAAVGPPRPLPNGVPFLDEWSLALTCERGTAHVRMAYGRALIETTVHAVGSDGAARLDLQRGSCELVRKTRWLDFLDHGINLAAGARHLGARAVAAVGGYGTSLFGLTFPDDPFLRGMRGTIAAFDAVRGGDRCRAATALQARAVHAMCVMSAEAAGASRSAPPAAEPWPAPGPAQAERDRGARRHRLPRPPGRARPARGGAPGHPRRAQAGPVARRLSRRRRARVRGRRRRRRGARGRVRRRRDGAAPRHGRRHRRRVRSNRRWPPPCARQASGGRGAREAAGLHEQHGGAVSRRRRRGHRERRRRPTAQRGPAALRGKIAAERELLGLHLSRGTEFTIVRPAIVVGEGGLLDTRGQSLGQGQPLRRLGRGTLPCRSCSPTTAHRGSSRRCTRPPPQTAPTTSPATCGSRRATSMAEPAQRTGRDFHFHPTFLRMWLRKVGKYAIKVLARRRPRSGRRSATSPRAAFRAPFDCGDEKRDLGFAPGEFARSSCGACSVLGARAMNEQTTRGCASRVFSTFGAGGPQIRALQLRPAAGPEVAHVVMAMDGRTDAGARSCRRASRSSSARRRAAARFVTNVRQQRVWLAATAPGLVLTYNWGAIETVAAAQAQLPLVHHEDGFGPEESVRRLRRRNWLRRWLLRGVPVVVPSAVLARIAAARWGVRPACLHHLPNGVDLARFAPLTAAPVDRAPVLGTVGELRPEKDHASLLRALVTPAPSIGVRIVGDGALRAELAALAAGLAVTPRRQVISAVTDTAPEMRALDVFGAVVAHRADADRAARGDGERLHGGGDRRRRRARDPARPATGVRGAEGGSGGARSGDPAARGGRRAAAPARCRQPRARRGALRAAAVPHALRRRLRGRGWRLILRGHQAEQKRRARHGLNLQSRRLSRCATRESRGRGPYAPLRWSLSPRSAAPDMA